VGSTLRLPLLSRRKKRREVSGIKQSAVVTWYKARKPSRQITALDLSIENFKPKGIDCLGQCLKGVPMTLIWWKSCPAHILEVTLHSYAGCLSLVEVLFGS